MIGALLTREHVWHPQVSALIQQDTVAGNGILQEVGMLWLLYVFTVVFILGGALQAEHGRRQSCG